MKSPRPKEGAEKDCITCGHPAVFYERPLMPRPMGQVGDHVPPAAEYRPTRVGLHFSENHFEPA